jgi:hypothetical protein
MPYVACRYFSSLPYLACRYCSSLPYLAFGTAAVCHISPVCTAALCHISPVGTAAPCHFSPVGNAALCHISSVGYATSLTARGLIVLNKLLVAQLRKKLWDWKVHYRVHNSLGLMYPVCALPPILVLSCNVRVCLSLFLVACLD